MTTRWNLFCGTCAVLVASASLLVAAAETHRRAPRFSFVLAQAFTDTAAVAPTTDALQPVERNFILQGLENSRNEAEVSRLAVGQAHSSAIRDFAQQLVGDYAQINASLENLARRKTVAVPVQPTSFSDRYRALAQQTGAGFDRAFMREIAEQNTRALRMCETAVAEAKDAEIRDLAGSLLPVVRDHVNKTTDLQKNL